MVKVKLGIKTLERQESPYAKFVKYAMENVRIVDVVFNLYPVVFILRAERR